MFIDSRTLLEDTVVESDVCIVGAGAAGITLAQELINQPYQVCLLESGGFDFDAVTQALYTGDNVGLPYFPLDCSRARYHGGSTNLWGGTSRPLDEIDFEARPWMPYGGWPITRAELDPYYERAQKICGLGPFEYGISYWEEELRELQYHNLPLPKDLVPYIFQLMQQKHLRFGKVYRAAIEQAPNIKTYLHANVVEIETNDTAQAATKLRVACLKGNGFWVSAKVFILAMGGIENPRLLLASNKDQSTGLGNQNDLVGRFFMEHPYLRSGKVLMAKPNALYNSNRKIPIRQIRLMLALGLSKAVQEREQLLNFALRLLPVVPEWVEAARRIKHRNRHEVGSDNSSPSLADDIGKVVTHLDEVVARIWARLKNKPPGNQQVFETHLISEQAPNPDSRVTLGREQDELGLNRAQLDWRLSAIDKYTIQRSQQLIGEELAQAGIGQLDVEFTYDDDSWELLLQRSQQALEDNHAQFDSGQLEIVLHEASYWQTLRGSYHHIGTTRMNTNPKEGVVNEHSQVHGVGNLYIAGSSVFPTSGLSNPTLTIVALATRLADHIKEIMTYQPIHLDIPLELTAETRPR